jgi:integrase
MPRVALTDLAIRSLKPGTWLDEKLPGFGLRVGKATKTWVVIRTQRRIRTTIGHYPALSLADARTKARSLLIAREEPKAPTVTFAAARTAYLTEHVGRESTKRELTRLLTKHFAKLDGRELPTITDQHIHTQITSLAPSEALHAFRAVRAMLRWCQRPPRRYLPHSPLEGYAPPGRDGRKTRILSDSEIKRVLEASSGQCGAITKLMLLWGTRLGETLALRRDWIVNGVMVIPGEATKNRRPHSIPILPLAQSVLDQLPEQGPFFFPGRWNKNTHTNEGSWGKLHREQLKASQTEGWTAHDARRTFRSACARLRISRDLAERLLNHAQGALDEIYDHYTYEDEKREALAKIEGWIASLLSPTITPPV